MTQVTIPEELHRVAHLLLTQDNRCTADPIFLVRGRRRRYGFDPDFADGLLVWLDEEGQERDDAMVPDPDNPPEGWIQTGFQDEWETIQSFFTEDAAKTFQLRQAHNHRHYIETDVYADSLHRNPEMRAVRDFLLQLPLNP